MTERNLSPLRRIMRLISAFSGLCVVSLIPRPGFAQSTDASSLEKRIDALEDDQKEIQKQLHAIQALLGARQNQAPPILALGTQEVPDRGSTTAKLALVEYFDYECPYCATFFDETMPQLSAEYIITGKVKYVVRDYPLEANHPFALRAAVATHCANDQGKFWPMHDELMGNSDALDRKSLSVYAKDVGLDVASFDKCVDSEKHAAEIKASEQEGSKLGVEGTPTFFLGVLGPDGKSLTSVQRFDGAVEYAKLKTAIDRLLAQLK